MNKCGLCQQIKNNLIEIYNNRIKTLAQIILKLKGFKESLEINNVFAICESCKQGIENVAKFWEHIPEAKSENLIKNDDVVQEIYESQDNNFNTQSEINAIVKQNLPPINLASKDENEAYYESTNRSFKLVRKRKICVHDTIVNPVSSEERPSKRHRRYPKCYDDFMIDLPSQSEKTLKENVNIYNELSLDKLPQMASIRSISGMVLGKIVEIESSDHTSRMRIVCEICSNIFYYEKEFQKHLEMHKTKESLKTDVSLLCNNYLYYCKLCEKSFQGHYAVRRHYKFAHSEERPLKCEHCAASFKYKFNLDYHMAKHVLKKRFECSYCKKAFVLRYELQIHVRTHTKERPYKCEFCELAFAHRTNLKTHQKLKHLKDSIHIAPLKNSISSKENNQKDVDCKGNFVESAEKSDKITTFDNTPIFAASKDNIKDSLSSSSASSKSIKSINIINVNLSSGENKIVVRSDTSNSENNGIYDIRKQLRSSPSLYPFKIGNTTLRITPHSPLLKMKKWSKSYPNFLDNTNNNMKTIDSPKSTNSNISEWNRSNNFQVAQTNENPNISLNKTIAEEYFSKKFEVNTSTNLPVIEHKSKKSTISEWKKSSNFQISQTNKSANIHLNSILENKNSCENITEIMKFASDVKTCNNFPTDSIDIISTNNSEISSGSQFSKNSSSCTSSNLNLFASKNIKNIEITEGLIPDTNIIPAKGGEFTNVTNLSSTKSGEINDIGKCSNFSPIVLDSYHLEANKIVEVQDKNIKESNLDVPNNNENNTTKRSENQVNLNMIDKKAKIKSQKSKVFKVSSKPVKIIDLKSLKNSTLMVKASNKMNLPEDNSLIKIIPGGNCQSKNDCKSTFVKTPSYNKIENIIPKPLKNSSSESLLKPKLKAEPVHNLPFNTTTNIDKSCINLASKPLITKIEVLPPLTTLPTLIKSLTSATTPHKRLQPPTGYKYQCPHCWKYFKQKSPLTKHLRTHTGEKPYKCNLCPKSYADASNYKKHKILHKNAAEALNISRTAATYPIKNSPAHSTVSDPDPDGIEIMQTINKFEYPLSDESDDIYDDDDDNISMTSSTMESYMWQDALEHALMNNEIRENIKRNLASLTNAIMSDNMQQHVTTNNSNNFLSSEYPD